MPKDKPLSFVIGVLCLLSILLILGPLLLLFNALDWPRLVYFVHGFIMIIGFIGFVMGALFVINSNMGKYKGLRERPWRHQVW